VRILIPREYSMEINGQFANWSIAEFEGGAQAAGEAFSYHLDRRNILSRQRSSLFMRRLGLVIIFAAALACAQDYSLGPDSQPQSGVPKGSVAKYELKAGAFYPGTPHTYSIYFRRSTTRPSPRRS
jgi:hypothetical protein